MAEVVAAGREDDPIDALLEDVDDFAAFQEDDITIVALRRLSSAAEAAEAELPPCDWPAMLSPCLDFVPRRVLS